MDNQHFHNLARGLSSNSIRNETTMLDGHLTVEYLGDGRWTAHGLITRGRFLGDRIFPALDDNGFCFVTKERFWRDTKRYTCVLDALKAMAADGGALLMSRNGRLPCDTHRRLVSVPFVGAGSIGNAVRQIR